METKLKTRKKRPSSELVGEFRSEFQYAVAVMRYWNTNQFDGRFKTLQTQRAEDLLRECGIDPSEIGKTPKPQHTGSIQGNTQDSIQDNIQASSQTQYSM